MEFKTQNIRESQRKKAFQEKLQKVKSGLATGGTKALQSLGRGIKRGAHIAAHPPKFWEQRQKAKRRTRWIIGLVGIVFGVFIIFEVVLRVLGIAGSFRLSDLLWVAGADLPKDEYGMTNVLLLGIGGDDHSGGTLTDTIIIASIDYKTQSVVLLSLPRDFYVESRTVNTRINSIIRDVMAGYARNEQDAGYNAGVALLKETIANIFHIDIDRYAQIDFHGFEEGIDALGGVDIMVPETIDDAEYPDDEWGYERFFLPAGEQHLDGAKALKFVRSRHSSSDFARSDRQRLLIEAIREKAISLEILTSPKKIQELLNIVQSNTKTDLTWREMLSLANVGYNFPRENIFSFGLNDNETTPGGFLVTPDRDLYNGASVLVPFLNLENDKYAQIRPFTENIFRQRELQLGTHPINVLNATSTTGLAGETATHLERFGFHVSEVQNSDEQLAATEIRFVDLPENRAIAERLQSYIKAALAPQPLSSDIEKDSLLANTITIVVGQDSHNYRIPEL